MCTRSAATPFESFAKQHILIKPKPAKYALYWEPKPYIAGSDLNEHPCPEDPNTRILLAVHISKTQFERHATYEANTTLHATLHDNILLYTTKDIILVLDPKDIKLENYNIYAIAIVMGTPVLFGKLQQDTELYNKCLKSFQNIFTNLQITP